MPKYEISDVTFNGLVNIGSTSVQHWGSKRPAHDPNQGKQSAREIKGERGETLAVVISYEAGNVRHEIEVPAGNIRCIVRTPIAEPEPPVEKKPEANGGKGGGK